MHTSVTGVRNMCHDTWDARAYMPQVREAGHLYLIHGREFVRSGENVGKVGRSKDVISRQKWYPKGSVMIHTESVQDTHRAEQLLLHLLRTCETREGGYWHHEKQYGTEYFRGDFGDIVSLMRMVATFFQDVPTGIIEDDDASAVPSMSEMVLQLVSRGEVKVRLSPRRPSVLREDLRQEKRLCRYTEGLFLLQHIFSTSDVDVESAYHGRTPLTVTPSMMRTGFTTWVEAMTASPESRRDTVRMLLGHQSHLFSVLSGLTGDAPGKRNALFKAAMARFLGIEVGKSRSKNVEAEAYGNRTLTYI